MAVNPTPQSFPGTSGNTAAAVGDLKPPAPAFSGHGAQKPSRRLSRGTASPEAAKGPRERGRQASERKPGCRDPSHHLACNPEADAGCAARPALRFRVGRAATSAPLAAAAPRPRTPDLGRRRPPGCSRGHMAEGDAGSDQRQVRARRDADLQARLGLASPSRASSAERPSVRGRPHSRPRRLLHRVTFSWRLFSADRPPASRSRASAGSACLRRCRRQLSARDRAAPGRRQKSGFCFLPCRRRVTLDKPLISSFCLCKMGNDNTPWNSLRARWILPLIVSFP